MKKITPAFNDDKDRLITVSMLILSMFTLFIPSVIVIFLLRSYISESSYQIAKAVFNLELLLFLISLLFAIPIIGWIAGAVLGPIIGIANVVILVIALCAIAKGGEVSIPVMFEFL